MQPASAAAAKIGGFSHGSQALRITSARSARASATIAAASLASTWAAPKRSSPSRATAASRALGAEVGEHHPLEEAAAACDGGGRGADAARSDDEDAHEGAAE